MTDSKQKQYRLIKSILARKFIFYIVLFSSIITLLGTSLQLYLEYSHDKSGIQNTLDQIGTTRLNSIVNNLWVNDQELINVQMSEILSLPDIQYIAITSDDEENFTLGTQNSTKMLSQEYLLTYSYRNQDINLGSLHIEATLDNVFKRLYSRVFVILMTQGIKTFLVSLFIFFVFYLLVGRHLRTMADFARRIDLETIDTSIQLDLPKRGQPDELDQVVSSLNEMHQGLRQSVRKLNTYRDHLEDLVKERTVELTDANQALQASEAQFRRNEERFRLLYKNAPLPYQSLDSDGFIIEVNDIWLATLGYSKEEVIGQSFGDFLMPEMKEHFKYNFSCFKDKGEILGVELEMVKQDGSVMLVKLNGKIGYDMDGNFKQTHCIFQDITEQRKAENNLNKYYDDLEQKVKERTLELRKLHEQLMHSEKLSAIGDLSASIAHEFNNPLQGILTVIKGVKRRASLDDDDVKLVDMAVNECNRMKDLIKSLQDFNRPSSGRVAPMDIHATIDSLLLLSKNEYKNKGVTVEINYTENMPQIKAVADQIKQVLLNMFNNAAYACKGGDTITITTEVVNSDAITVKVQDTGKGIKPDHVDKIFDPFFTTKPVTKGTGLGLSISYGIIKNHGGRIDVESELNTGTTFTITLPIAGVYNAK